LEPADQASGKNPRTIASVKKKRAEPYLKLVVSFRLLDYCPPLFPFLDGQRSVRNEAAKLFRLRNYRFPKRVNWDRRIIQVNMLDMIIEEQLYRNPAPPGIGLCIMASDTAVFRQQFYNEWS
jgi:hypothetical protein